MGSFEGACPDTDGDGVTDDIDKFLNDSSESADSDHDGVGDNADPDKGTIQIHDSGSSSPPTTEEFPQGFAINLDVQYAHYMVQIWLYFYWMEYPCNWQQHWLVCLAR